MIWHPAQKKGYSGVMSCSRVGMVEIERGIDTDLDETRDPEGRVLVTKHGNLSCINMYLPNGSARQERQDYKDQWLEDMLIWSQQFLDSDAGCQITSYPSGSDHSLGICSGRALTSWNSITSASIILMKSSSPFLWAARIPFRFQVTTRMSMRYCDRSLTFSTRSIFLILRIP